jgi:hypothetical protein
MAAPNIVNVSTITGSTSYLIPSTTSATTWTALTPTATGNVVHRVDFITASNVTSAAATVTLSVNSAISGGGTAYRIAYQITVPANSTLVLVDKTTALYIDQTQSIVATVGTASALEFVASYEAITAP